MMKAPTLYIVRPVSCALKISSGVAWVKAYLRQARVYVVELNPERIDGKVGKRGLIKATNVFESASLSSGNYGEWEKRTLDVFGCVLHILC